MENLNKNQPKSQEYHIKQNITHINNYYINIYF